MSYRDTPQPASATVAGVLSIGF